jgi:hypothetical protein
MKILLTQESVQCRCNVNKVTNSGIHKRVLGKPFKEELTPWSGFSVLC